MTRPVRRDRPSRRITLYTTAAHPCSYLEGREATTVFVDPFHPIDEHVYGGLAAHGFRRSGRHVYRPHCRDCRECIAVRVAVDAFRPRRRHRRAWRANDDVIVRAREPEFDPAHFDLYRRYLESRHPGGGMDDPTPRAYREFLICDWAGSVFYEMISGDRVVAVAVTDRLANGLSAVYTFFEPTLPERSLGSFSVLWQIAQARHLGLPWLYLGYWIEGSGKMRYKAEYLPQERFIDGSWHRVEA